MGIGFSMFFSYILCNDENGSFPIILFYSGGSRRMVSLYFLNRIRSLYCLCFFFSFLLRNLVVWWIHVSCYWPAYWVGHHASWIKLGRLFKGGRTGKVVDRRTCSWFLERWSHELRSFGQPWNVWNFHLCKRAWGQYTRKGFSFQD